MDEHRLQVHTFDISDSLGRLIDGGSTRARLLLAYLHAFTSQRLPGLLTGLTGTRQTLKTLGSAAVRSCDVLTQEETDPLARISQLTPEAPRLESDTALRHDWLVGDQRPRGLGGQQVDFAPPATLQ